MTTKILRPFWSAKHSEITRLFQIPSKKKRNIVSNQHWFNIESIKGKIHTANQRIQRKAKKTGGFTTKKIKLLPDPIQRQKLMLYLGIYRFYYNLTINQINENYNQGNKPFHNFFGVLKQIQEKTGFKTPEWSAFKIPNRIMRAGIKDCCESYKSSFALKKSGYITHFKIGYKARKTPVQTLTLFKDTFSAKHNTFFLRFLGNHIKSSIPFKGKINHDCKLQYNAVLKQFYLIVLSKANSEKQAVSMDKVSQVNEMIGLDPGKRKFLTGFDGRNVLEIGRGVDSRLKSVWKSISTLQSKISCSSKTKARNYLLPLFRRRVKLRNLVEELHCKAVSYLTSHYNHIFLGDLSTKNTNQTMIHKSVKTMLSTLGFYRFRLRLENKCKELGIDFKLINEAFTSRTCSNCGFVNQKTASESFTCSKCRFKADRDHNAAKNITLKGLIKIPCLQRKAIKKSIKTDF